MEKYFIDLFAGAGGLAEGFVANGFTPLAHVEMNKNACDSLITRLAYHYLKNNGNINFYYDYLKQTISRDAMLSHIDKDIISSVINKTINDETIDGIFDEIDSRIIKHNARVDAIIGGPPCQAYSLVGRSTLGERVKTDKRNWLFKLYIKFLKKYKPQVFVFENVAGLLSASGGLYFEELMSDLKAAGYNIEHRLLDASDFGVLQSRKRIIIIGTRSDLPRGDLYPTKKTAFEKYIVNDLLNDLPPLIDKIEDNHYFGPISEYCRKTGIRTNKDVLTQHITRYNNQRDKEIYKKAIQLWNKSKARLNYNSLPERLKTHKNRKSFVDRFKVVAGESHCSHTVLAHLAKDGHYFIHPDLKQCRSISVREAARLQSFPDSYYFEGSRGSAFTQIGNAVPPLLSCEIAKQIFKYLEGIKHDV